MCLLPGTSNNSTKCLPGVLDARTAASNATDSASAATA